MTSRTSCIQEYLSATLLVDLLVDPHAISSHLSCVSPFLRCPFDSLPYANLGGSLSVRGRNRSQSFPMPFSALSSPGTLLAGPFYRVVGWVGTGGQKRCLPVTTATFTAAAAAMTTSRPSHSCHHYPPWSFAGSSGAMLWSSFFFS